MSASSSASSRIDSAAFQNCSMSVKELRTSWSNEVCPSSVIGRLAALASGASCSRCGAPLPLVTVLHPANTSRQHTPSAVSTGEKRVVLGRIRISLITLPEVYWRSCDHTHPRPGRGGCSQRTMRYRVGHSDDWA